MPYFILSLIIQVGLVVHVLKTGRNMSWIFILLFFPLVGTLAYLIVELLPEFSNSRGAHQARRQLSKTINPDRELRQATQQLAVADTVKNAIALAEQYLQKQRYGEARDLYQRYLKGIHADDPQLMTGLAQAQFGLGEYQAALDTLERFKEKHPQLRSADAHLIYARSQHELGNTDAAIHEYEALRGYFPGPEPTCRLATLLKASGQPDAARELFQKIVDESRVAGSHYNRINQHWVAMARRELPS
ncbi:tetratricopeptide repeat protein [Hydrocarboniphaga sp.]|uniref:tetratricopeptide repeat protein n=1 Tax=Hydrocarboniphaga sp. TaxID=2033016 RepID=UPI003D0E902E